MGQLSLSRTSYAYPSYNETSAYLDLSPLYGVDEIESKEVRVVDGRGMLAPDCFFEDRVIYLSPAVSVLLILLNRNHNVRFPLSRRRNLNSFSPLPVYCPSTTC